MWRWVRAPQSSGESGPKAAWAWRGWVGPLEANLSTAAWRAARRVWKSPSSVMTNSGAVGAPWGQGRT